MKSLRWMISYAFVALVGLWMAFAISMKLMAPARSQEAPANGELPAEFMKEVEQTQVPPPPSDMSLPRPRTVPPRPSNPGSGRNQIPASTVTQNPGMNGGGKQAPEISPNLMTGDNYFYDPVGKRDPFKPVGLKALGLAKPIVLEPLQRFELEKLQVVGILWDVRSPRAMVKDPDGVMHTVIKNSKIGRLEGFVAAIREGEIVVVETVYEDGKTLKQTRVMEMKK